ncbi:MAG: tail fiber domain-containing protein [Flavobacteriales bacterium]|nr:hypothetical protein [Flavobacteriales bacterium]MCC6577534.1 tail fiber domain-containing protein [Flavobacteriales bacterium]
MRTKNFLKHLILGALLLTNGKVVGQSTTPGNVALFGTDFLGWDNTFPANNFPLMVRHDLNQPIEFHTAMDERMRLSPILTGQTINTYPNLDLTGFQGVGDFGNTPSIFQHPAARVHAENNSSLELGYRPMIGEGFLATRGESLFYTGLLDGLTSGVVWSTVTGQNAPTAPLQFIYTGHDGTSTMASSASGLELARLQPDPSLNEGYFGVGDWTTIALLPDERIDLADRTIRLRNFMDPLPNYLTTSYENAALTRAVVVDPDDGRLYWRDLGSIPGCDWEVTTADHVVTAHLPGPLTGCPDESNNVGIGTSSPGAKLDVLKVVNGGGATDIGVNVRMGTTSVNNFGGNADVYTGSGGQNLGWRGSAMNAGRSWGLDGNAATNSLVNTSAWTGVRVVGVRGFADGNFQQQTNNIRGVWGIGLNPQSGGWGYGGWFDGYAYCSLGIWSPSDATLKQNVEPLTNAMDVIGQLQPMSYTYRSADFPTMALDDRAHYGLIAQDLENVLPALVQQSGQPAVVDSLGNEVFPAVDFKAVNYEGLTAWLIAGLQEQQTTINTLQDQLASLQQDLATCCAAQGSTDERSMSPGARLRQGFGDANAGAGEALHTDLFIVPNPVADHTQLRYTVATPGRTRLEVSDAGGKRLVVLEEAVREAGAYTHDWTTTDLAPGTYHVTLFLNDSFVVKKAVKVGL